MKHLTLFRHAKSSWKYPVNDIFRPLNGRGLAQADAMARACKLSAPDLVLTSPAVRATSTALIYGQSYGFDTAKLQCLQQIYDLDAKGLLRWLQDLLPQQAQNVWIFGHNPTLNEICYQLLGEGLENIVTAGYVNLEFNIQNWQQMSTVKPELREFNNRYI